VGRARKFVSDSRLTNVEVLEADARTLPLPARAFDLATARLVLVNVPRPEGIVAEMIRIVRPVAPLLYTSRMRRLGDAILR